MSSKGANVIPKLPTAGIVILLLTLVLPSQTRAGETEVIRKQQTLMESKEIPVRTYYCKTPSGNCEFYPGEEYNAQCNCQLPNGQVVQGTVSEK